MGKQFSIAFHNARIKPESYPELIGWTAEEAAEEVDRVASLALEHVVALIGSDRPTQTADGIDLSGCAFHDSAGHTFDDELHQLLSHCEPGAYTHEIDVENGSGRQWRSLLLADGSIRTVAPVLTWPGMEGLE